MRLDKFLKVSRLIKRRTVANEVSDMGRVFVNDNPAKPGKQLKEGDIISVDCTVKYKGYCSDCAYTYGVGNIKEQEQQSIYYQFLFVLKLS